MPSSRDIFKLDDHEVKRILKNQLIATVGTYGSQRGCSINMAIKEFR